MIRTTVTRIAAATVAIGLSLATLTACVDTEHIPEAFDGDALVLITAAHANTPAPALPQSVQPLVSSAINQEIPIAVIGLDGTPEVARAVETYDITRTNPAATANDIRGYEGRIATTVRGLTADSDGSDLAGALFLGRDQAASFGARRPVFVLVDSGLPDTGNVVLTHPGMTIGDPATLAGEIVSSGRLPELAAHVYLVGFGYTASPQQPLSPRQRDNVTQLWQLSLEGVGATVTVLPVPRAGDGPETAFVTKLVEVSNEPSIELTVGPLEPLVYGEGSSLSFLADQAAFVDPAAADATLDRLAAWLTADASRSAVITGTTARAGTPGEQRALGTARVATVADGLVARGVDDGQITRLSVGSQWPGYTPDHRSDGSLDEAAAALNRTTQIELRAG
jgi:OOP family OmpA-OmpF porin